MKKLILIICVITFIFLYINKNKNTVDNITPQNINKTHVCSCDSMILMDYNGPKAQIIWSDKTRSYYCEVREIFYEVNDKTKNKRIKKIFVQDFSNLEWGSYNDKWIDAKIAYYVIDSKKDGAMGVTYVPFLNIEAANKFTQENEGKILKFEQIDNNVLMLSNELLKKRLIF